MLSLFPIEYWILLFVVALTRVISGQLIHWRLATLKSEAKYKKIIQTVSSKQFRAYLRFNGITHILFIAGLAFMWYMTYTYVVPITYESARILRFVQFTGNFLIAAELGNAIISIVLAIYLLRQK